MNSQINFLVSQLIIGTRERNYACSKKKLFLVLNIDLRCLVVLYLVGLDGDDKFLNGIW